MVLAELGGSISSALRWMNNATVVDEKVLNECLNEITRALLQSDVQFNLVRNLQTNIKKIVNFDDLAAGHNKRKIIQQAVFDELCRMLDPGESLVTPKKGEPIVVMFVGLQGSGKTTSCTKYAHYHQNKSWKPALVCADTFRAGAFDQLKQNATKANIPFYGSYEESDQAKIAVEGVERFKQENFDLIIVDTSGRHKQEAALFEEMRQVSEAISPDLVIFVMDASIGQSAFNQAQAFKDSVAGIGAVIVTKLDGGARGGGALSAVAATKSPVVFIGTGEHMDQFEVFDVKSFVRRLLGMGDLSGIAEKIEEVVPMDQQSDILQKILQGNITLRVIYELYQTILKCGPMFNQLVTSMMTQSTIPSGLIPGGSEKESQAKMKRFMTVMDSMTTEELDSPNLTLLMKDESRIMRISRGSGHKVREVMDMIEPCKAFAKNMSKIKGTLKRTALSRNMNARGMNAQMLNQIGGMSGLKSLMKFGMS